MSDELLPAEAILRIVINDGSQLFPVAVVEYQGALWLAPEWKINDHEGWRQPTRLICLAGHKVQDLRGTGQPFQFALSDILPKPQFEALCRGQSVTGWQVAEAPALRFRSAIN